MNTKSAVPLILAIEKPDTMVPWPQIPQQPETPLRRYNEKVKFSLVCSYSGLVLGDFFGTQGLAIATPYVTAWKQSAFLHPIFSLKLGELLFRANANWELEKTGTRQFPMLHKQLLFLAMLHASGCIRQEVPGLPAPRIVEVHFPRLLEMLGWKHEMASERIKFPRLHIWKGAAKEDENNLFASVPVWLDACEVCRDEYENITREHQKAAKIKAKELAMKSVRRAMYADISLRRLWNWVQSQVPQMILENNPDLEQLFFAEESKINVWTRDDIEALEDLVLKNCELGNSVSHEVNKRIRQLEDWRATYFDTFEIMVENKFTDWMGKPEPKSAEFTTKALFTIAHARWTLGNQQPKESSTTTKSTKITGDDL